MWFRRGCCIASVLLLPRLDQRGIHKGLLLTSLHFCWAQSFKTDTVSLTTLHHSGCHGCHYLFSVDGPLSSLQQLSAHQRNQLPPNTITLLSNYSYDWDQVGGRKRREGLWFKHERCSGGGHDKLISVKCNAIQCNSPAVNGTFAMLGRCIFMRKVLIQLWGPFDAVFSWLCDIVILSTNNSNGVWFISVPQPKLNYGCS